MSSSASLMRVAFQGEPGAFSEDAALALLGPEIDLVARATFGALFSSLAEGLADYAIVPVENTLVGTIQPALDLFLQSSLLTAGEVVIQIRQQLIGCPGASLEQLETVESHAAALAQCRRFLVTHPRILAIESDDTAGSVRRIIDRGDLKRGAIAGRRAAALYGGSILKENIEDDPANHTRFLLLAAESSPLTSVRGPLSDRVNAVSHSK